MLIMYLTWSSLKRPTLPSTAADGTPLSPDERPGVLRRAWRFVASSDVVDVRTVDLRRDEHEEEPEDAVDDAAREGKLQGRARWLWRLYYAVV